MDLAGPAILLAVLAGGALWSYATSKARVAARAAFARELGLHILEGGWLGNEQLFGEYEGVPVAIEYFSRSSGDTTESWTRVLARGVDPLLHLSSENVATRILQPFTRSDFRTGDPMFDQTVLVRGPIQVLMALLDSDTRARVATFVLGGHRVEAGEVRAELRGHLLDRPVIEPILQDVVRIATRLQPTFVTDASLARIAIEDLQPGVRRKALRRLRSGDPAIARETHVRACDDWDPTVRIDAFFFLRDYARIEAEAAADVAAWAALEPESVVHVVRRFRTEASLTGLLGYSQLHELACARLAVVGGAIAVESLRTYAEAILGAGRPARDAMAAIHARLGHAPGSLSISSADGGGLSEAGEPGALSRPEIRKQK